MAMALHSPTFSSLLPCTSSSSHSANCLPRLCPLLRSNDGCLTSCTSGGIGTARLSSDSRVWLGRMAQRAWVKRRAKFQQFSQDAETREESGPEEEEEEREEEDVAAVDGVLPQNLETAIIQASDASAVFINSGGTRAIAELLVPDLENLNEDGAQQRLWDLARLYLDTLKESLGDQQVKAIFPDAGVAALVKYQWKDAPFSFGSLNDRRPVVNDDEVVVLVVPDYQGLADVERIAGILAGDDDTPTRPLIMLNPRLISGDVGVGLNVRRMRERLLKTFTTVYSVRPLQTGTIFRQYPGLWQVFLDDAKQPGRLFLAKEQPSRFTLDDLDLLILSGGDSEAAEQPSALANAVGIFASFNRFIRSLSQ